MTNTKKEIIIKQEDIKEERNRWQEFKDSFRPIIEFFKWVFSDHS